MSEPTLLDDASGTHKQMMVGRKLLQAANRRPRKPSEGTNKV